MTSDIGKPKQIEIGLIAPTQISDVAHLHKLVLGDTLNARLGEAHLRRLYHGLIISKHGIVYCSHDLISESEPIVGFVSGTDDADLLQRDLIRTPGTRILLSLALGLAQRPWLLGKLMTQFQINRPIIYQNEVVKASLLTIGVRPDYGRKGIGHQLAQGLITEFRRRGTKHFHLNTKNNNERARQFYRQLGGQLWRSWRGNDIYLFIL